MKSLKQFLYTFLIIGVLAGFFIRPAGADTLLTRVADIYSGANSSSPESLTAYNGALYFKALGSDGTGNQLWKHDSATNTTSRVTNFFSLAPSYSAVYNGALYFSANGNDGAGQQLWKYDSTTNTASRVTNIFSAVFPPQRNPRDLAVYNGALYFTANGNDGAGYELWKYDGTTNTASRVTNIYSGPGPSFLAVYNGALYFHATGNDGAGPELWKYDSTTNTASRAADIASGPIGSTPDYLTVYNGELYFSADGQDGEGTELWKYDSATNTASRVTNIFDWWTDAPKFLAVYNGALYFQANANDGAGHELWKYDSATNTASRVTDLYSGPNGSVPAFLAAYNGALYFNADGNDGTGSELWKFVEDNTPPTVVSTSLLASNVGTGPATFTVTFSEAVNNPAGNTNKDDVTNPNNYLLVNTGANSLVETASCSGGVVADDIRITVTSVIYDSGTFTSRVTLASALPPGKYRLFVCGTTSIVDIALTPLNNGAFDYIFGFVVTPGSLSLPDTGFAPNRITSLSAQPSNIAYMKLDDIWMEIPALNVKANIVGVPKLNNTWDVDWLGNDTGWLNGTAFPSWDGNSVITGHVYNASGLPGPFANLKSLKYGDQIIIHLYGGQYIFEIRKTLLVRPGTTDYALQHLEDNSFLTLITCQGYNEKNNSYRFRRIVRAVLIEVRDE
ncbi:MAG: sortase [Anaerolineales bacterium]|nr:sortase [Anaerolineales bacterium]